MNNENKTPETENSNESRNFFIRTYLNEEQVRDFIKTLSVAKWAYIRHDERDGKEPHIHLLLRLNNRTTLKAIEKKLKAYSRGKDDGKDCNFNAQIAGDIADCFLYLTHESTTATAENKALYDKGDIRTNDYGYFRGGYSSGDKVEHCAENTSYQILTDMERGTSLRNMAKRYGREFIINFNHYSHYLEMMRLQEMESKPNTEKDLLDAAKALQNQLEFINMLILEKNKEKLSIKE